MQEIAEWADKDTIMFIEVDNSLVMPKSRMFSHDNNPRLGFIDNMVALGKRDSKYNKVVANWYQQRQLKLVEVGWGNFIEKFQTKGAKVYGFCSMPIRLINIEKKRVNELVELGVSFTNKINAQEELQIEKMDGWSSSFYKGVIFTGPYNVPHTLIEFIKITNISPKKLVIINHTENVVKKIDKSLRVFDMDFYSVLYLGVKDVAGKPDRNVAKLQQQELIYNGKWLEDDAAGALLKARAEETKK